MSLMTSVADETELGETNAQTARSLYYWRQEVIGQLPTPIATLFVEYVCSRKNAEFRQDGVDPFRPYFVALHRLFDASEMVTRFMCIILLKDIVRVEGDFSEDIIAAIFGRLERPTLIDWINVGDVLLRSADLPAFRHFVTGLNHFWNDWTPFVRESLLPLPAGVFLDPCGLGKAPALFETISKKFESFWSPLLALFEPFCLVASIVPDEPVSLLQGPVGSGQRLPVALTADILELKSFFVYLFRKTELHQFAAEAALRPPDKLPVQSPESSQSFPLDPPTWLQMSPFLTYNFVYYVENETLTQLGDTPAVQVYLRLDRRNGRCDFTACSSQLFLSLGDDCFQHSEFAPLVNQSPQTNVRFDFQDLLRELVSPLVGRSAQIDHAWNWIHDHRRTGGVLRVDSPKGFGVSSVMAALCERLMSASNSFCVVPFFFRSGDVRCSPKMFYFQALWVLQAELHISGRDTRSPSYVQFGQVLDFLRSRLVPKRSVVFVLDGIDEVSRMFPNFVDEIAPWFGTGIIWVTSGLPPDALPSSDALVLPPLSYQEARHLLEYGCPHHKYALFERDTYDANTGVGSNPFMQEVMSQSQGSPLYLRLVAGDINQSYRTFRNNDSLPHELSGFFEDLIIRLEPDTAGPLSKLVDVLSLLCWANEPLTEDILFDVLNLDESMDADELTEICEAHTLLQRKPTMEAYDGWVLTYGGYREWLRQSDLVKRERKRAFRRLLKWCGRWYDHMDAYALRQYPRHLFFAIMEGFSQTDGGCCEDLLFNLASDDKFRDAQLKVLKSADWRLSTPRLGLEVAIRQRDPVRMTEMALALAQLVHDIRDESPLDALRSQDYERLWNMLDHMERDVALCWYLLVALKLKDNSKATETVIHILSKYEAVKIPRWVERHLVKTFAILALRYRGKILALARKVLSDQSVAQLCGELVLVGLKEHRRDAVDASALPTTSSGRQSVDSLVRASMENLGLSGRMCDPASMLHVSRTSSEVSKLAEAARITEAKRGSAEVLKMSEVARIIEANRSSSEVSKLADAARIMDASRASEAIKLSEWARIIEANRAAEAARIMDLTRTSSEMSKILDAARIIDANKPSEASRMAEAAHIIEQNRAFSEASKLSEAARIIDANRASEAARVADVGRMFSAGRGAEATRVVSELRRSRGSDEDLVNLRHQHSASLPPHPDQRPQLPTPAPHAETADAPRRHRRHSKEDIRIEVPAALRRDDSHDDNLQFSAHGNGRTPTNNNNNMTRTVSRNSIGASDGDLHHQRSAESALMMALELADKIRDPMMRVHALLRIELDRAQMLRATTSAGPHLAWSSVSSPNLTNATMNNVDRRHGSPTPGPLGGLSANSTSTPNMASPAPHVAHRLISPAIAVVAPNGTDAAGAAAGRHALEMSFDGIKKLVQTMRVRTEAIYAMLQLCWAQVQAGFIDHAHATLLDVLPDIESVDDTSRTPRRLSEINGWANRVSSDSEAAGLSASKRRAYNCQSFETAAISNLIRDACAWVAGQLALNLAHAGRPEEAMQVVSRAQSIAHSLRDSFGRASSLRDIASVYHRLGHASDALASCKAAEAVCRNIDDVNNKASAVRDLAVLASTLGDTPYALALFDDAIRICTTMDVPRRTVSLRFTALACARCGLVEKSRMAFDRTVDALNTLQNAKEAVYEMMKLASAYSKAGFEHLSRETFRRAAKQCDKLPTVHSKARQLLRIAAAQAKAGHREDCQANFIAVMFLAKQATDPASGGAFLTFGDIPTNMSVLCTDDAERHAVCTELCAIAVMNARDRMERRANTMFSSALETAAGIQDMARKAHVVREIASVQARVGSAEMASKSFAKAIDGADSIRDPMERAFTLLDIGWAEAHALEEGPTLLAPVGQFAFASFDGSLSRGAAPSPHPQHMLDRRGSAACSPVSASMSWSLRDKNSEDGRVADPWLEREAFYLRKTRSRKNAWDARRDAMDMEEPWRKRGDHHWNEIRITVLNLCDVAASLHRVQHDDSAVAVFDAASKALEGIKDGNTLLDGLLDVAVRLVQGGLHELCEYPLHQFREVLDKQRDSAHDTTRLINTEAFLVKISEICNGLLAGGYPALARTSVEVAVELCDIGEERDKVKTMLRTALLQALVPAAMEHDHIAGIDAAKVNLSCAEDEARDETGVIDAAECSLAELATVLVGYLREEARPDEDCDWFPRLLIPVLIAIAKADLAAGNQQVALHFAHAAMDTLNLQLKTTAGTWVATAAAAVCDCLTVCRRASEAADVAHHTVLAIRRRGVAGWEDAWRVALQTLAEYVYAKVPPLLHELESMPDTGVAALKPRGMMVLAAALHDKGDHQQALVAFAAATAAAERIPDAKVRVGALCKLLKTYAACGVRAQLVSLLAHLKCVFDQASHAGLWDATAEWVDDLCAAATSLHSAGHLDDFHSTLALAQISALHIDSRKRRSAANTVVCTTYARAGLGSEARRVGRLVLQNRRQHLPKIAKAMLEGGCVEQLCDLFVPCGYKSDVVVYLCSLLIPLFPHAATSIAHQLVDVYAAPQP